MMPDQASDSSGNIIPFERPASASTPSRLPVPGRQENAVEAYRLESSSDSTSGGDGGGDDLGVRVGILELGMQEVKLILKDMVPYLARLDATTSQLPNAQEFGELKNRIQSLPTIFQIFMVVGTTISIILAVWKYFVEPLIVSLGTPP